MYFGVYTDPPEVAELYTYYQKHDYAINFERPVLGWAQTRIFLKVRPTQFEFVHLELI